MFIWDFRCSSGISDIYIGFQTFLWEIRHLCGITNLYLGYQIFIWDITHLYGILDIYIGFQTFILDFRHLYGISDIYLGFQMVVWDFRFFCGMLDIYLGFQTFFWDFRCLSGISGQCQDWGKPWRCARGWEFGQISGKFLPTRRWERWPHGIVAIPELWDNTPKDMAGFWDVQLDLMTPVRPFHLRDIPQSPNFFFF